MRGLVPLLACLALAACAVAPEAPGLLGRAEIDAAARGSTAPPDNAALLARAARLSARAAALRRTTIDSHEAALARRRGLR